jgi:aspartyl/asparaginyl beta-hydroxylase (cupin superfamily)
VGVTRSEGSPVKERALLVNLLVLVYSGLLWAVVPRRSTFDLATVPGLAALQETGEWRTIQEEVDGLLELLGAPALQRVEPGHSRLTRDEGWRMAILRLYDTDVSANCEVCPRTMALLRELPGVTNAMVSVLEPGKRIPWHPGIMKGVIRCHLPLRVPSGDCGIRIGRQTFRWREGEPLLFDDSYPHRAWNSTGERRVVLLLDLVRPMPWAWLDRLNRWVVGRLGRTRRFLNTVERANAMSGTAQRAEGEASAPPLQRRTR